MDLIYLDTNAFYFFFFEHERYTNGIKKIFRSMQDGEYKGITNCITLDELAYVILMRLIEKKYKKHPADVLRGEKFVVLEFIESIRNVFDVILSLNNLDITDASKDMLGLIPILIEETSLLPRDCIHLQTMRDRDCRLILSTDTDFDRIDGIERIKPDEI